MCKFVNLHTKNGDACTQDRVAENILDARASLRTRRYVEHSDEMDSDEEQFFESLLGQYLGYQERWDEGEREDVATDGEYSEYSESYDEFDEADDEANEADDEADEADDEADDEVEAEVEVEFRPLIDVRDIVAPLMRDRMARYEQATLARWAETHSDAEESLDVAPDEEYLSDPPRSSPLPWSVRQLAQRFEGFNIPAPDSDSETLDFNVLPVEDPADEDSPVAEIILDPEEEEEFEAAFGRVREQPEDSTSSDSDSDSGYANIQTICPHCAPLHTNYLTRLTLHQPGGTWTRETLCPGDLICRTKRYPVLMATRLRNCGPIHPYFARQLAAQIQRRLAQQFGEVEVFDLQRPIVSMAGLNVDITLLIDFPEVVDVREDEDLLSALFCGHIIPREDWTVENVGAVAASEASSSVTSHSHSSRGTSRGVSPSGGGSGYGSDGDVDRVEELEVEAEIRRVEHELIAPCRVGFFKSKVDVEGVVRDIDC
ncbi:uncharacterized protein DSM5745_02696 [Aspergillus mulundensis]|uniref:Uncharacterized protein n=1 Tax=Aspergillus mulundensis TaxID=1810919 RepID=A0A3D8SIP5_9EURO|nr:hypothetical protein DSM5745_02696 [Aspergillus mulundensis]RDW86054.1 hypothetical protein DSM5745_02696 [Aspergillus mulundensis]